MRYAIVMGCVLALWGTAVVVHMAKAQGAGGALVVATCGTLGQAYVAGSTRRITVNTNGQVCQ